MHNDLDETKLILRNQPVEILLASSASVVSTWAEPECRHTVVSTWAEPGCRHTVSADVPGAAHPSAFKVLYQA